MSTTPNLGLFKHDNPSKNTNKFDVEKALNKNWDIVDEKHGDLQAEQEIIQAEQLTQNTNINNNATNIEELTQRVGDNETHIENIKQKQTIQDNKLSELETGLEENFYNKTELDKLLTAKANQNDLESLQERVSTNETDITNIQEEQVDQNTNIENLQTENQKLEEKLAEVEEDNEKLRKVFPSVKGEGSEITLNGTAECKMDIKVKGNTEQEQYNGSNLYNVNDKTDYAWNDEAKIDENGFITVTYDNTLGEEQKYINLWTKPSNLLKNNANYYIVLEVKNVKGDGKFTLYSTHNTNSPSQFSTGKTYNLSELNNNKLIIINASTLENFENSKTMLRTFFTFYPGDSGSITFRLSVLENQPTEDTFQYEPYTGGEPAPNPNFIIPIKNCGDNVNQLDLSNFEEQSINGITIVKNEDGSLTLNGTANKGFGIHINIDNTKLTKGEYVHSIGVPVVKNFYLSLYKTEANIIENSMINGSNNTGATEKNFILSEDTNLFKYLIYFDEGATFDNYTIYPKLEKGTKATPYSPYGCGNININKSNSNLYNAEDTKVVTNGMSLGEDGWITCTYNNKTNAPIFLNYFTNVNEKLKVNTNYSIVVEIKEKQGNFKFFTACEEGQFNGGFQINDTTATAGYKVKGVIKTKESYEGVEQGLRTYLCVDSNQSGSITFRISILEDTEINIDDFQYVPPQEQNYPFTLEKGQRLHKDDYLADDGIHGKRETIILTGTENWRSPLFQSGFNCILEKGIALKGLCSHYKALTAQEAQSQKITGIYLLNSGGIIITDLRFTTVEEFKTYLAEEYSKGTPVIVEVEYKEYKIFQPYTQTQQKQYNAIKKAMSYAGGTHITATSENANPILEVEAVADMSSVINNFDTRLLALESEV